MFCSALYILGTLAERSLCVSSCGFCLQSWICMRMSFIIILFTFSQPGSHPLILLTLAVSGCASHLCHFDFLTSGETLCLRGLFPNSYLVDKSVNKPLFCYFLFLPSFPFLSLSSPCPPHPYFTLSVFKTLSSPVGNLYQFSNGTPQITQLWLSLLTPLSEFVTALHIDPWRIHIRTFLIISWKFLMTINNIRNTAASNNKLVPKVWQTKQLVLGFPHKASDVFSICYYEKLSWLCFSFYFRSSHPDMRYGSADDSQIIN